MPARDVLKGKGIEALPSGRYKVRFRVNQEDGQPKQLARTLPDLESVLRFHRTVVDNRGWARPDALTQWDAKPTYEPVAPVPTLSEFIDDKWLTWAKERNRNNTLRVEQSRINVYLKPAFGKMRLDAITRPVWFDYAIRMTGAKGQQIADSTKKRVFDDLCLILKLAVARGVIPHSPLALPDGQKKDLLEPKRQRAKGKKKKATLSDEQFNNVLNNVPEQHRPLIWIFALTSLRANEVAGLQWRDWDEANGILRPERGVVRGEVGPLKTEESERDIAVTPWIAEQLKLQRDYSTIKLRRQPKPEDFIFATSRGTPFNDDNGRQDILYPALQAAGIQRISRQHGWHCLRRSVATIVTELCGVYAAKQTLGHTDVRTTQRYIQPKPDGRVALMLENYWKGGKKAAVTPLLPAAVTSNPDAIN